MSYQEYLKLLWLWNGRSSKDRDEGMKNLLISLKKKKQAHS